MWGGNCRDRQTDRTARPASHKGRVVESETTTTKKKGLRGRGNRTGPRWKRTFWSGPGDAYLQRPKTDFPHLNWRISPASPHMRPSIHHPSTLYHFSGVAPHGGGNPQSWPTPTPPLPPSLPRGEKPSLKAPTGQSHPPIHPPGISSTRTEKKRVWHSTAANRQGGVGRP